MNSWINKKELFKFLKEHFRLDWDGIHGAGHWARVMKNGLDIAKLEGAREDVVTLFALLHDHERQDDDDDYGHGHRAAIHAEKLKGVYFDIDDSGFEMLKFAMEEHSNGRIFADITIQTCWDADRLDLGRVGIIPDPQYLCTNTAKDLNFLNAAYQRSIM